MVGTGQPGRPSKGAAARKVKGSLWLSPQEVDALIARWGSVGKGLRALVDDWVRGEPTRKRLGRLDITGSFEDAPVEVLGGGEPYDMLVEGGVITPVHRDTTIPVVHRHRRGAVIRVDYEYGTPKKVYSCAECGEELA